MEHNIAKQQEKQQKQAKQPTTALLQQHILKNKTTIIPPPALSTNKNGLPFYTQQALLSNVCQFRGLDDFSRDTCDSNTALFGERNSKLRKACQDKRRHFIEIYRNNPTKFLQLCADFDTLAIGVDNKASNRTTSFLLPRKINSSDSESVSSSESFTTKSDSGSTVSSSTSKQKPAAVTPAPTPLLFQAAKLATSAAKFSGGLEMSHRKLHKSRKCVDVF